MLKSEPRSEYFNKLLLRLKLVHVSSTPIAKSFLQNYMTLTLPREYKKHSDSTAQTLRKRREGVNVTDPRPVYLDHSVEIIRGNLVQETLWQ